MPASVVVLVVVLAAATALGVLIRRWNGHFRGAPRSAAAPDSDASIVVAPDEIGGPLGPRATLLQFSSAFCAPCRSTRRILAGVADVVPGVAHVEVDAESHLDLVRRLGVMRTPTTFVLDADGTVVTRASGQPRTEDVLAALSRVAS